MPHRSSVVQHPTVSVSHHFRPESSELYSPHKFWHEGVGEEEIVIPTKQVVWIISLNYMGIFRRSDAYQSYLSQLLSPRTQEAHGFGVFCWEHCRLWRLNALFFSGDVEMSLLFLFLRNLMVFFHNFIFFYLLSIISSRLDQFLAIFLGSKNSNVL